MAPFSWLVLAALVLGVIYCGSDDPQPRRILVAQIVFESGVFVVDAESGERLAEDHDPDAFFAVPRFSPDGRRLAYYYAPEDDGSVRSAHLGAIDIGGGDRRLSPPLRFGDAINPTWSPDGTRLASGVADIVVLDADMKLLTEPNEVGDFFPGGGGPAFYELPWSSDSQYVATFNVEGITLADRDGAVFTLGVDVLAAKGPSGIGFDPQNDVLRLVRWQDDTTLRLFVLRSGRVQPGDDEPPELRYFRVDGTVGGGHVAWMPPVEMTAAEQLAALGFPPQAEWEALLDRAMGEVPDAASDQPIAMFLSADGSAWAAGVPYGQRPGGRGVPETWQLVILTQQPVAVEMEEEYGRARRLQNVLDVIVTTGD